MKVPAQQALHTVVLIFKNSKFTSEKVIKYLYNACLFCYTYRDIHWFILFLEQCVKLVKIGSCFCFVEGTLPGTVWK